MRIGILTYHRAHNYGAMLQAYALRTFLQNNGHEVCFIDYCSPGLHNEYKVLRSPRYKAFTKDYVIGLIALCLTLIRRWKRHRIFLSFARKYLSVPKRPKYSENNFIIDENIDLCIVGSDQVWRNRESDGSLIGFDDIYFGTAIPIEIPCISYAASMGIINLSEADKEYLREKLPRFCSLLVREQSLKKTLHPLGFESEIVCDPVMLLDKKQWNAILSKRRFSANPYILYYEVLESKEVLRSARRFAKSCGLELKVIRARVHVLPIKGVKQTYSPIQLVQAIRDAEFIITTSFHGTAFSILFEKQFYTMGLMQNSNRVVSLLEKLELSDRYVGSIPDKRVDIDYGKVKESLQPFIDESVERLNRNIAEV
jgi:hypothetical protein